MTTVAYRYRAARADGTIEHGSVRVQNRDAAAAYLSERSLFAIELEPQPDSDSHVRRIPSGELAVGLRTLGTLLESGLPIGKALAAFEDVAPPRWQAVVPAVRERVRQGDGLGMALERAGSGLGELFIGIIQGAENGNGLAASVSRAAAIAESSAALRAAIRNALAYPALLAAVGTVSIALVVSVVLPRFAAMIADAGSTTPALTRAVMAAGNAAALLLWPAVVLAAATPLAWRHWMSDPRGRQRLHSVLLGLPAVGALRLTMASSRMCAALAAVLQGGVPVASGLQLAARSCGDAEITARLMRVRERVVAGSRLSTALGEEQCVTATARRLVRAGEESGQLALMLDRAAMLDMDTLSSRLRALVRLIEPTLIIAFAGIIALVAAALLQAVYSVRPT